MSTSDRICLVTGATSGIGAATALGLARMGATVVLAGRDPEKCSRQAWRIQRETGRTATFLVADLSVQGDIRRMAGEFEARYPRLDVLVNNAGGYFHAREVSADGIEMTFALNHLGYFMVTSLLLDRLRSSGSGRVVNVASEDHRSGRIDFDDLMGERQYDRRKAYAQSKLANLLFTYELARRLGGSGPRVNALCPGSVRTNLGANNGWLRKKVAGLMARSRIPAEAGADTPLYLASSPDVAATTGRYFIRRSETLSSEASRDEQTAERLWRISQALTGMA